MREFTAQLHDSKKRVDSFLFDMLPDTKASVLYKAFRKRSVKVNGKRVKESYLLVPGDKVELYVPEDYLNNSKDDGFPDPEIIYEDKHILIVSKPQGMPVHQDKNVEPMVLEGWVQGFIQKRDNLQPSGFPALCHRLDRNTGGLVLMAKDQATSDILLDKFRNHEIRKTYLALVEGIPEKKAAELIGFLKKESSKNRVYVYDHPIKGSERIITRYRVLKNINRFSLLEIDLVTGKTHQIRAHLSYIGHPLVGDGKYGINELNRALKLKWQALWAVGLRFEFTTSSAHLAYLNDKVFYLPRIPWEEGLKKLGLNGKEILLLGFNHNERNCRTNSNKSY